MQMKMVTMMMINRGYDERGEGTGEGIVGLFLGGRRARVRT